MALFKDLGIIFKIKDFSEADKLVSILGKKRGRIDAIAKGARRPTSRKTGSVDLFNKGKFSFAEGKSLDILTEAELLDSSEKIKEDLGISKYLFYFAELIDVFFPEVSQGEELFDYFSELLDTINKENKDYIRLSFELKLLQVGGFGPNLDNCNLCGEALKENVERVAHAGSEIGFICRKHLTDQNFSLISDRAIKTVKFISEKDIEDAPRIKLDKDDLDLLKKLNKIWIQSIIGKEIKSYKFLER